MTTIISIIITTAGLACVIYQQYLENKTRATKGHH